MSKSFDRRPLRFLICQELARGFPLKEGAQVIGRSSECDISLPNVDNTVSRKHATLTCQDGVVTVTDNGSFNKTYVDRDRIEGGISVMIPLGSVLRLGSMKFVLSDKDFVLPDTSETTDHDEDPTKRVYDLTKVQLRVLLLLLAGKSEKEVGTVLKRKTNTIHNHVKDLHLAFDVSTRSELLSLFIGKELPPCRDEDGQAENSSVNAGQVTSAIRNPKARYLVCRQQGLCFQLKEGSQTVGRSSESDIVLPDQTQTVSRKHVILTYRDGVVTVSDNGSHNETFVDDRRVEHGTTVTLEPGSVLRLGSMRLTLGKSNFIAAQQDSDEATAMDIDPTRPIYDLTIMQLRVLLILLRGKSVKEVGQILKRKPNTIQNHIKDLHTVFKVSSRSELLSLFIGKVLLLNQEMEEPEANS